MKNGPDLLNGVRPFYTNQWSDTNVFRSYLPSSRNVSAHKL